MIEPPDGAWFFKARLGKDMPFIGICTFFAPPLVDGEWLDRSPRHQALIRNETSGRAILLGDLVPIEVHNISLRNLERIDEAEWRYLVSHAAWAVKNAPSHPAASPKVAIDRRGKSVF